MIYGGHPLQKSLSSEFVYIGMLINLLKMYGRAVFGHQVDGASYENHA